MQIIAEEHRKNGAVINAIYYRYGADGIVGFKHNNIEYVYRKNIQGDITHIYTKDGELVVKYAYDAWGNHNIYAESGYAELANLNPFRYRGYYYDITTKLYYLNARYYDPQTGRFINADDITYLDPETINGLNLYSYSGNNPIMRVDPNGIAWWDVFKWIAVGVLAIGAVALIVAGTIVTGGALGAVLIGAGVGAIIGGGIGGVNAYLNGSDIASGILGGSITGAALGAAAPLAAFGAAGFGIMLGTTFVAGMGAYMIETLGNGEQFNVGHMFAAGAFTALQGMVTFGMSSLLSINKSKELITVLTKGYLAKAIAGQFNYCVDLFQSSIFGKQITKSDIWLKYLGVWAS